MEQEKCVRVAGDGRCVYSLSEYHLKQVSGLRSDPLCGKCDRFSTVRYDDVNPFRLGPAPKVLESPIPVGERRAMRSKSRMVWSRIEPDPDPSVSFNGLKDPYDTRGFYVVVEVLERPFPMTSDWVWVKVVACMRIGDAELGEVDDSAPFLVRPRELKKIRKGDVGRMKGWDWEGLFVCNCPADVRRMVYSIPAEFTVAVRTECKRQDQCEVEWKGEGHPPTGGCYCLRPYANIVAYFCAMDELRAAGKPPWGKVKPRYSD